MEDKWFIYWNDDALFFHRSWTGFCIYVVRFAADGATWRMIQADVNRDRRQYEETDDDRDARLISYLIDVLLLGRHADSHMLVRPLENRRSRTGVWLAGP